MKCRKCGACCKFIKLPILTLDSDKIHWLNLHKNMFVDDGFLYIFNKCSQLNDDGTCKIYDKRPQVCRYFKAGSKDCIEAQKLANK